MKKKKHQLQQKLKQPTTVDQKLSLSERKSSISYQLAQALTHVKDFMTDSQKSLVLLREGKILFDNGDIRGALDCFNEAISHNPSVTLFGLRGSCHRLLERYSDAYFDYSFNIRIEPEVGSHYCNRALCLAKLKKASLALEDLGLAIQYDPSPVHFYSRATVNAEFGKLHEAITDFTAALNEDVCGVGGAAQNNSAGLTAEFKLKCRYRRALVHFDLGNYSQVIEDCGEVLMLDAQNVPARALLGRAFKVLNEHQKAEEQLNNAILLDSHQAALYTERGDIRFRTGQRNKIVEAIYDFDQAIFLFLEKLSVDSSNLHGTKAHKTSNITPKRIASRDDIRSHNLDPISSSSKHNNNALASGLTRSLSRQISHDLSDEDDLLLTPISSRRSSFQSNTQLPVSSSNSNSKAGLLPRGSFMTSNNSAISAVYRKELDEQLADTYYKRAQAKLLIECDSLQIEEALRDVLQAIEYCEDDDDYHLVASTCYLRLNRFDEAKTILEKIIRKSPNNFKALYNLSYCKRIEGDSRNAIEELTKIIALNTQNDSESFSSLVNGSNPFVAESTNQVATVPIHRVYEMRGTLLHEVHAHKLALMDLGKAIAINPSQAMNFYLRGDCHFRLGNYEQALLDYNMAESKQFSDMSSLYLSRGIVKRLLKDLNGALQDFAAGFQLFYHRQDLIGQIRALSFIAFCHLDCCDYQKALSILMKAAEINQALLDPNILVSSASMYLLKRELSLSVSDDESSMFSDNDSSVGNGHEIAVPTSALLDESSLLYCKRASFIISYHTALAHYMTQNYVEACKTIGECVSEEKQQFIPDDMTLGTLYFFLSQCQIRLLQYETAQQSLSQCYRTHFVDSIHNKFLVEFASAKLSQYLKRHEEAIVKFSEALNLRKECPFCYFRRAWSFKATGNYVRAGDDFETAKLLRPNDPNFLVDYKHINKYEYMEIATEPDFMEKFVPLLPVPGLNS